MKNINEMINASPRNEMTDTPTISSLVRCGMSSGEELGVGVSDDMSGKTKNANTS